MRLSNLRERFTIEYLQECFEYRDGKLYWKARPLSHFKNEAAFKIYNGKLSGKEALGNINGISGYAQGGLDKVQLSRSVIVYAVCKGKYPNRSIRHIDNDRANDRIENLRDIGEND